MFNKNTFKLRVFGIVIFLINQFGKAFAESHSENTSGQISAYTWLEVFVVFLWIVSFYAIFFFHEHVCKIRGSSKRSFKKQL